MSKILIVEDVPDLVRLYQKIFRGHETTCVGTAWAAIAALEQERHFDLVILDMYLPEVPGMVVLQHLRKMPGGKKLNVFIISADETLRRQAEVVGIQMWLNKPVEIEHLLACAAPYLQPTSV